MLTLLWLVVSCWHVALVLRQRVRRSRSPPRSPSLLGAAWFAHTLPGWAALALTLAFVLLAIPANVPSLRRKLVSDRRARGIPQADAADVADGARRDRSRHRLVGRRALFRAAELAAPARDADPSLTAEEQRFLDDDVEELCAMVTDWETTHVYRDLPPRVWQFIKDRGFLGMSIAKEYGGLGFSAYAHSQVMTKLSTHSGTVSVTVMVPNSLGPGELLAHYGTDEQKRYYLPRLAKGLEIPCFALTAPTAGSDAASIPDFGIVCWGEHEGRRVLGLSRHVGQALHHARPRRDAARPRLPRLRSRAPRRRSRGHRHHLRADSDVASGRA